MMKIACALLLLVAAVSCAPTTPDTLVAEDSKFVPGYGLPYGLPNINWGAIHDAISKHIDDYYEIEIDLSGADSDLQSAWPGRGCPCMNNNKVRSFWQCKDPDDNNKYLEFVRLTHGTNWQAEMEKCAKKEGKYDSVEQKREEEFTGKGGKYEMKTSSWFSHYHGRPTAAHSSSDTCATHTHTRA